MKFSVHIPVSEIAPGEFQNMDAINEIGKYLDRSKIDACHVTDHPAPSSKWLHAGGAGHDALDPFTSLAFIAAVTNRILLHTYIIVMPYRNPFITAKAAATLQILSGGRLILGTGGGYQKAEFEALGVDFHKRGALFDEALQAIQAAWAGGPVEFEGMNFKAIEVEPRPVPNPKPPIWVGGASDKAVERAARWGDGWVPVFTAPKLSKANRDAFIQSTEQLRAKIVKLKALRASLGKAAPFDIAIGPQQDPFPATRQTADRYIDCLHELADAGVTWAVLDLPHPSRQAYIENLQWFDEEVISHFDSGRASNEVSA